jgi:hypothetical protein
MTEAAKLDVANAIEHLNQARELLERTTEIDLCDTAEDIGPILLALEDWQRGKQCGA